MVIVPSYVELAAPGNGGTSSAHHVIIIHKRSCEIEDPRDQARQKDRVRCALVDEMMMMMMTTGMTDRYRDVEESSAYRMNHKVVYNYVYTWE